jgi:hypothetical protein
MRLIFGDFVGPKTVQKYLPRKNLYTIFRFPGIGVHENHNVTAC